jgi:hypothetical protein
MMQAMVPEGRAHNAIYIQDRDAFWEVAKTLYKIICTSLNSANIIPAYAANCSVDTLDTTDANIFKQINNSET